MGYRALVIEDHQPLADVLRMKLEREGHEVVIAPNQRDAYHLLEEGFDFILLDLRLPSHEGDSDPNSQVGFDILDHIRDRFARDRLPVIVMTAYEETSQTAVRALTAGANDYITKPFEDSSVSFDEKLAAIARCIEETRRATSAKKRHKLVFTNGVEINGILVANRSFADLLRLLASKTLMISREIAAGEEPRMTGGEIAKAMDVKEPTVRQYVTRFRKWIAAEYEQRSMGAIDDQDIICNPRDWKGYELNFKTSYISRE
jgi:CheY-like chemotaxis protein